LIEAHTCRPRLLLVQKTFDSTKLFRITPSNHRFRAHHLKIINSM